MYAGVDLKHRHDLPVSLSSTGSRGSWRDHRERDRDRDYSRGYDEYEGSHYQRPYRTKSGSWGDGPESGNVTCFYSATFFTRQKIIPN